MGLSYSNLIHSLIYNGNLHNFKQKAPIYNPIEYRNINCYLKEISEKNRSLLKKNNNEYFNSYQGQRSLYNLDKLFKIES